MINFLKKIIKNKENQIISFSQSALELLNKDWSMFLKKDTYLIFETKEHFLNFVMAGGRKQKIPWYFFWNNVLKIRQQKNLDAIYNYKDQINNYNPEFIKRKKEEYKDLFKKGDHVLDDDQQTAIITDDKHNLVVAGAGSGKTEVLITRIAYLIKNKTEPIKPEKILALAFQSKAANEMSMRLRERYGINVEIRTFHSLGLKILNEVSKLRGVPQPGIHLQCTDDWKMARFIKKIYEELMETDYNFRKVMNDFIFFFGDKWRVVKEADFSTKEAFYKYMRHLRYRCLDGEKVKSYAERRIKNFFLSNYLNGKRIEIKYEQPAEWMNYSDGDGRVCTPKPDFYFPEFDIYFEHWAIDENGKVPEWFDEENRTEKYIESMNLKKEAFTAHGKILIETTYAESRRVDFRNIIESRFLDALRKKFPGKNFELRPLKYDELIDVAWDECRNFISRIDVYIQRYITLAKTYKMMPLDIRKRLEENKWSIRQQVFSDIALRVFDVYQEKLKKSNKIDFSDMINYAVDGLEENKDFYLGEYDHILIDEFQDISAQRYNLIKELMSKNKKCKLFCVGDDWQSIMGFSGSDLSYFMDFNKYFNHASRTDLTVNYRSSKTVVDVGVEIIKHNRKAQIDKKAVAHSNKLIPIAIYSSLYPQEVFYKYNEQIAVHCLDQIKKHHKEKNIDYKDFLILTRINMDKNIKFAEKFIDYSKKIGVPITFEKTKFAHCVRIMTAHKSKGLQARVVIILKVDEGSYGFPSSLSDPDIFEPVLKNNDGFREDEERRLFYVAVTRAKEEVIMYSQKCIESRFITEIKKFVKRENIEPLAETDF